MNMRNVIIYKFTNKLNGMSYVGQTVNLSKRISAHLKANSYLGNALRKYGLDQFSISVLGEYEAQIAGDAELYFGEFHNCLYPNGYCHVLGGPTNRIWSEESLKRASESKLGDRNPMYGKSLSSEHLEALKISGSKPKSAETKQKLSKANLGKKATVEAKANMSKAGKVNINSGRFKKGTIAHNRTSVIEVTTGQTFESIKAASLSLNVDRSCIFAVLKGETKSTKGFIFKRVS